MIDPNDPRNEPRVPCSWAGCTSSKEIGARIALCRWHYNLVRDDWLADNARTREEQAAKVKAVSAKLEAGEDLAEGEVVPGWVYYIRVGDLVKIGFAKVLKGRLAAYPPSCWLSSPARGPSSALGTRPSDHSWPRRVSGTARVPCSTSGSRRCAPSTATRATRRTDRSGTMAVMPSS